MASAGRQSTKNQVLFAANVVRGCTSPGRGRLRLACMPRSSLTGVVFLQASLSGSCVLTTGSVCSHHSVYFFCCRSSLACKRVHMHVNFAFIRAGTFTFACALTSTRMEVHVERLDAHTRRVRFAYLSCADNINADCSCARLQAHVSQQLLNDLIRCQAK